jgi:PBP1b-binding outer membrane lipoprotein LpoB
MKKYSNWLAVVLVLALAMSFTGCSSEPQVEETSMEVTTEAPADDAEQTTGEEASQETTVEAVSLEDTVKAYFAEMPRLYWILEVQQITQKVMYLAQSMHLGVQR